MRIGYLTRLIISPFLFYCVITLDIHFVWFGFVGMFDCVLGDCMFRFGCFLLRIVCGVVLGFVGGFRGGFSPVVFQGVIFGDFPVSRSDLRG